MLRAKSSRHLTEGQRVDEKKFNGSTQEAIASSGLLTSSANGQGGTARVCISPLYATNTMSPPRATPIRQAPSTTGARMTPSLYGVASNRGHLQMKCLII